MLPPPVGVRVSGAILFRILLALLPAASGLFAGTEAAAGRDLDSELAGRWVLDFALTEALSHQRLGIGDASIRLVFEPEPGLALEKLPAGLAELAAGEPVRSAGQLELSSRRGTYLVTGEDGRLVLHFLDDAHRRSGASAAVGEDAEEGRREPGTEETAAEEPTSEDRGPWSWQLVLRSVEPPGQGLLILGGSDRFEDPPKVYARQSSPQP